MVLSLQKFVPQSDFEGLKRLLLDIMNSYEFFALASKPKIFFEENRKSLEGVRGLASELMWILEWEGPTDSI